MKTLIIVDVQNDFMPGGALEVPKGNEIVPVINELQHKFELVVATQDWHPPAHASFASSHPGKKAFEKIKLHGLQQSLWPEHCVQNSYGAEFHSELKMAKIEAIFRKGTHPEIDSYSGFYDNAHQKSTGLAGYLKEKGATELYFCGLAAEICVFFSLKDALQEDFNVFLIEDATRPLHTSDFEKAIIEIKEKGGVVVHSKSMEAKS